MGAPEPSAERTPDMVAGSGTAGGGDHMLAPALEFALAAPELQHINDDWEKLLRKMFDKEAEAEAERGGAVDGPS